MKKIPEIDLKDAVDLTAMEMNTIHFDTGDGSNLLSDSGNVPDTAVPRPKVTSLADLE